MDDELGFSPDVDETEESSDVISVEFKPVTKAADFRAKADKLMSDAMDLLNAKIRSGFAEASDIKTAVEIAKLYKVGVETVDEAAEKAMREAEAYAGLGSDDADGELSDEEMRFEG